MSDKHQFVGREVGWMISIRAIKQKTEIETVVTLAKAIWNEYFPPIIGQAQVDYMVDKYQSIDAITQQIEPGYEYFFIISGERALGYLAIFQDAKKNSVELSKFYVRASERKRGAGNVALSLLERNIIQPEMTKISLRVSKHNENGICAYNKLGFIKVDECIVDIGNGFVMDDYIFEKML